jgi:hypothetical protein
MAEISRKDWYEKRMIDLNPWHRRLHRITGAMALHWCRVTATDLEQWSRELRGIAGEMQVAATANGQRAPSDQASSPETNDPRVEHENRQ